ncbi:hypothetical protein GTU79_09540 [Sodalis ligni]|uniref:hypothetical protein n=1 Tax=Sodalis ligni TaxID=2697027 RepID=UPI00193F70CB|nr:hypothetical protein [Sodalis ligni]QWA12892.1 hypothetical protein GTU79_09540 [Sodalis ligni]
MLPLRSGRSDFWAGLVQTGLRMLAKRTAPPSETAGRVVRRYRLSREASLVPFDGCGGFIPLSDGVEHTYFLEVSLDGRLYLLETDERRYELAAVGDSISPREVSARRSPR